MDHFIVSARKYRPATFDTVVGQRHITGTLKNAIKNNQLAQAFLFCGPRGVGKTTCARILARTINCQQLAADTEACGNCESCVSFRNGSSFSIHELDAASNNSVDDIRSLIEQVRIPPQSGKFKIYIIDEVHMLSQSAFNAFLKTLEEPPSYAIFILATTEKHKILPTILSRCQIFDFNRIRVEDMASHLAGIAVKEGVAFDPDGLHLIAQKADGGLRDALSMFDQIVSFSNKNVTYQAVIDNLNILDYDYYFRITEAIVAEQPATALLLFDKILNSGFDGSHFIAGLSSHFRDLLMVRDAGTLDLLQVSESIRQRYAAQSKDVTVGLLLSALNIANQCEINYRMSKNQRLQVELALLKMCHLASAIQLARQGTDEGQQPVKKKPEPSVRASPAAETTILPVAVAGHPAPQTPTEKAPGSLTDVGKSPVQVGDAGKVLPPPVPDTTPEKVVGGWKSVSISTSVPSLETIFDDREAASDAEPDYITGSANEPFVMDELLRYWHQFADQAKAAGKISLFTLMTAHAPKLTPEYQIEVSVENAIQENLLTESKIDMLNFLRQRLRNFSVGLLPVSIAQDVKRKPYTNQEKYQAMAAKNPLLDKFRQEFNLGFE